MEKNDLKERSIFNPFKLSLGLSLFAFLCNLVAFVSPYWLVSIPKFNSQFIRLGLWEACFNKYVHPEDYVSKKYDGCWYVYYPEFDYIRSWLNPSWFYAVQWFATTAFVCNLLVLIVTSIKACNKNIRIHKKTDGLLVVTQFIAWFCLVIVIVTMGVMSKDRQWMPRHDQNQLSWSFGFEVIAGFATAFATMTLSCYYMLHHCPHGPCGESPDSGARGGAYQQAPIEEPTSSLGLGTTSAAQASAKHREAMESYRPPPPRSAMGGARSTGGGHSTLMSYADSTV